MGTALKTITAWFDKRLDISVLRELAAKKTVPQHRHSIWYYFGGMTLFLFLIQVVTGILLMLYYRPSAEGAYESVQFIMTKVPFGWLVRSIHSWSANLMIAMAVVHLFSVFFLKAYRAPRELTWMSGFILLLLSMGFGFSGYLLPWNKLAFFATQVGTDIAGAVPLVGEHLLRFLDHLRMQCSNKPILLLLDEIDAFLDPANVQRVAELISDLSEEWQFIIVSLRDVMIARARTLIGVYNREGISHTIRLNLEDLVKVLATEGIELEELTDEQVAIAKR